MKSLMNAPRRGLAAGLAGVLVAGAASVLAAAPAQAATPVGSLSWNVSEQFVSHLSTRTLTDGAAFDATAKQFSFPATSVSTAADGTVTTQFGGSVKAAFVMAGTEYYSVTIANPVVVAEADGDGHVEATVSAVNAESPQAPAASTTPARVKVVDFAGATTASGTTTATPKWAGVLPAGSAEATALGIAEGKPLEGKSFSASFLTQLTPGLRSHFYAAGSQSDAKKAPGALSLSRATVTPTVVSADRASGVSIKVEGKGFNPTTKPGDDGVYAVLAPADTVIDFGNRASLESMTAADWVSASRFTGDSFSTVLNASTDKLKIGTQYAIFTWQAHTHSNTTQDTKTLVTIDWSKFAKYSSKTQLKVKKKATRKKAGKAVITIKAKAVATGQVKVTVKVPGTKKAKKVTVKLNAKGKATVKLPKAKRKGTYKVTAKYAGDDNLAAAKKVKKTFKVKR